MGSGRRHGNRSVGYGVSKSVGESKEVVKQADVGQIIITNKRFVFSGNVSYFLRSDPSKKEDLLKAAKEHANKIIEKIKSTQQNYHYRSNQ